MTLLHTIVGCGSIGSRHMENLRRLGETRLVAVDPIQTRRDRAEACLGAVPAEKFDSSLAEAADVVWVTLPSSLHMEVATLAAQHGCHLFIEKPLATSDEGVDALVELAERNKLTVMVGSNWKFHPDFQRMRQVLSEGAIGEVRTVRCVAGQWLPDWHPWEDYRVGYSARRDLGGGALFDSHELDYLTWLLGPVEQLICWQARLGVPDINTEDVAQLLLRFTSGALGQVQFDYLQRPSMRRYEFCGSEGTMIWDLRARGLEVYLANEDRWTRWETPRDFESNDMYLAEIEHFLGCVTTGAAPVTPLKQGMAVLRLIQAAHLSNGQMVST